MPTKESKRPIRPEAIKVALGIAVFLFDVLFGLAPFTILRGLCFPILWPFGTVGYFAAIIFLLLCAFYMVFGSKIQTRPGIRLSLGVLVALIGGAMLASDIGNVGKETYKDISAFHDALMAAMNGGRGASILDGKLSGGALGYTLSGLLAAPVGRWLALLAAILVLISGLVVMFFPLIVKAFNALGGKVAISRSKKERKTRKKEEGEEVSPDVLGFGETDAPYFSEPEETSVRAQEQAQATPEPLFPSSGQPAPQPSYARAGSIRVSPAHASREIEPSPIPAWEPSPYPYANSSSRSQGRSSALGVQIAFLDLSGNGEERSEPPMLPPVPVQAPAPSAPARQEIPEPEPEVDFRPSFIEEEPQPAIEQPPVEGETIIEAAPVVEAPIETTEPEVKEEPVPEEPEPAPAPKESDPFDMPDAKPLPPYRMPGLDLLNPPRAEDETLKAEMEQECLQKIAIIDQAFIDLGVGAHVSDHVIGPSVTRYAIQPDANVSVNAVGKVIKDLEMRLGGVACRFSERVVGLTTCAIEVANDITRTVPFYEVFTQLKEKKGGNCQLPFGVDITGRVVQADLTSFPHMLVCGTTGSGKSVFMHGVIVSLLMRNRPEWLKLMLIDPKRVEMSKYKDVPHLLCPIVKEPSHAKVAFKKLCDLMDHRYTIFEHSGTRDIEEYNNEYAPANNKEIMPYIVVFVDEYADLVDSAKDIQEYVLRIAQKARACGIHMVIATQRPDVIVITGTIKANLPTRVALSVSSTTDSMTILGEGGAEDLVGHGDMLVDCEKISRNGFIRAQGCLISSNEIRNVCNFIQDQQKQHFDTDFLDLEDREAAPASSDDDMMGVPGVISNGSAPVPSASEMKAAEGEEKYQLIKRAIMAREFTSISQIQRDFSVGFPRAGKIFARLRQEGIIAPAGDTSNNAKGAKVLVHFEEDAPKANEEGDVLDISVQEGEEIQ